MIACTDLCKSFGNKKVLNGINFEISEGKIFGLLGPSGAGKTTLIKILTAQSGFDEGRVTVFNKEVSGLSGEEKKQIGIMMDQFGVYERLSCLDNLKIFADIYGISHTRANEILEYVGLKEAAKRSAANLSKGMGARLRFARVFMNSPKVIFLDEPTAGLDPKSMKAIHRLILEKKSEGCTIFLTTHNMEEASKLCDEVALLDNGKIVEIGNPSQICLKYNHKKRIILQLKTGESIEFSHNPSSAKRIEQLLEEDRVEAIHSSEPNLETVFLELTGRKLQEDE